MICETKELHNALQYELWLALELVDKESMKWGLIGLGQLGSALAPRLKGKGKGCLVASRSRSKLPSEPASPRIARVRSNREIFSRCDVVILTVKPSQVSEVARDFLSLKPSQRKTKILISAAAGVSTNALRELFGSKLKMLRVMPNTPIKVGQGMIVFSRAESLTQAERREIEHAFSDMGRTMILEEAHLDAVTGLSGCGPAYVFLIIEALAEAGVKVGLPRAAATILAAQTLKGAATLLLERNVHPAQLKDEVTTPKGCTIDGLMALEEGALRSTLIRAVVVATERASKLGYF